VASRNPIALHGPVGSVCEKEAEVPVAGILRDAILQNMNITVSTDGTTAGFNIEVNGAMAYYPTPQAAQAKLI
jgi:hypothetical protein